MNEHTHQSQHLALSVVCDSVFATAELKKNRMITINQEALKKTDACTSVFYKIVIIFKRLSCVKLILRAQQCGETLRHKHSRVYYT